MVENKKIQNVNYFLKLLKKLEYIPDLDGDTIKNVSELIYWIHFKNDWIVVLNKFENSVAERANWNCGILEYPNYKKDHNFKSANEDQIRERIGSLEAVSFFERLKEKNQEKIIELIEYYIVKNS